MDYVQDHRYSKLEQALAEATRLAYQSERERQAALEEIARAMAKFIDSNQCRKPNA
jgi:Flp pilus assembly protein TadG